MSIVHRDTDYAMRALARLAAAGAEFVSVSVLAQEEGAPTDFLRKIMQRLCAAGIVESRQGPFGGYSLGARPRDVTLYDVIAAVQGPVTVNECFPQPGLCANSGGCSTRSPSSASR